MTIGGIECALGYKTDHFIVQAFSLAAISLVTSYAYR